MTTMLEKHLSDRNIEIIDTRPEQGNVVIVAIFGSQNLQGKPIGFDIYREGEWVATIWPDALDKMNEYRARNFA